MTSINRYTDADLAEFKEIIEKKLALATDQYQNLLNQIKEITENTSGDYTKDITDFSSSQSEVEMLNTMASRQRVFIQDLQAALVRVKNKSYGICVVTGELIDKKRLIAVPTTTKSLAAKTISETAALKAAHKLQSRKDDDGDDDEIKEEKKKRPEVKKAPVIITKVIKKSGDTPKKPVSVSDDDDDDFDDILKDIDGFAGGDEDFDDDSGNDDIDNLNEYDEPYEEMDDDGEI